MLLLKNQVQILRALKCQATLRMGKKEDAYELAIEIQGENPTDMEVVEILVEVYNTLDKRAQAIDLYETVFLHNPQEEIGIILFQAYVAEFRYDDQQDLALRLYKFFNKVDYALWAIESMFMIAEVDPAQVRMIDISNLLLHKLKQTEGFQYTEKLLRVDVEVQRKLGRYADAIQNIRTYKTLYGNQYEVATQLCDLYVLRGENIEALNVLNKVLKLNCDVETAQFTWNLLVKYMDIIFDMLTNATHSTSSLNIDGPIVPSKYAVKALESSNTHNHFADFSHTQGIIQIIIAAHSSLKYCRENVNTTTAFAASIYRQSQLAELEFKRRLVYYNFNQGPEDYKSEVEVGGTFFLNIVNYVTQYYDQLTTAEEMIPFLQMLNKTHVAPLRSRLNQFLEKMKETSTNKIRYMKAVLTVNKILRYIGALSKKYIQCDGELWDMAKQMFRMYMKSLNHEQLEGTRRSTDEICLLAIEILAQKLPLVPKTPPTTEPPFLEQTFLTDQDYIFNHKTIHIIGMLEFAFERSPYNFDIAIMLIQWYKRLSTYSTALTLCNGLNLQNIHCETAGWLHYSFLSDYRIEINELDTVVTQITKFHYQAQLDIKDSMVKAYRNHNLPQGVDIDKFAKTLQRSYLLGLCKFHKFWIQFYRGMPHGESLAALREHGAIINGLLNAKDKVTLADLDIVYCCGVFQLRKLDKIRQAPYNPEELKNDTHAFQKASHDPNHYGKMTNKKYFKCEILCYKIMLDIYDRNIEATDIGVKELVGKMLSLEFLTRDVPQIKQFKAPGIISQRNQEDENEEEVDYEALLFIPMKFDTKQEFDAYKKNILSLIWKLRLMLLECSYRIMLGHDAPEDAQGTSGDIGEVLSRWEQITRYVEVLTITFTEAVNSLIPRQYVQFTHFHPGLLELHAEFLHGPLTTALFLQRSWHDTIPIPKLRENPVIEKLRNGIKAFFMNAFVLMHEFKSYLERARDEVAMETYMEEMMEQEVFQYYSLLPKYPEEIYAKIGKNMQISHKNTLQGLIKVAEHLNRVNRIFEA